MKKITVRYISQWDDVAEFQKDDCIPTCASMMVSYYGGAISPDQISKKIGVYGIINFTQVQQALATFGWKMVGLTHKGIEDLKKSIDNDVPFLAIIHYGDLPGRQDTYKGGHAVVVVGYDEKNIYVNDPDFWSPRRNEGEAKAYPIEAFNKAWQSTADGNYPGNFWFLDAKLPTLETDVLKVDIPTAVEEEYKLKEKGWYDKHWTYGDFIEEAINVHKKLEHTEEDLRDIANNWDACRQATMKLDGEVRFQKDEVRKVTKEKEEVEERLRRAQNEINQLMDTIQDIGTHNEQLLCKEHTLKEILRFTIKLIKRKLAVIWALIKRPFGAIGGVIHGLKLFKRV